MSRVQLALRVSDLEASITFYSKLVGVEPAKRQPGYANFAVAEPPLKRLCLAQALALDPALLLLDEPTSARDNAARDVVEAAVAGLAARRTVVLVSHDAEQVQRLCGHIIDLHVESDSAAPTQPGMTSTALLSGS